MKKNILLAACFLMPLIASAQNDTLTHERDITLAEAIALARTQSVDAAVALNELKTAYWEYRTFRADLLPEVNFTQAVNCRWPLPLITSSNWVPAVTNSLCPCP